MPTEAAALSPCDSLDYPSRLAAGVEAHAESLPAIIAAHFQSAPTRALLADSGRAPVPSERRRGQLAANSNK